MLLIIIVVFSFFIRRSFAQESIISNSLTLSSPEEKLHALTLTRFHFITLKQFHSALFSIEGDQDPLSDSEAYILNTALNAFLTSSGRETMLLEALRRNKAIQLRFSVPETAAGAYQVIMHPTKPLLYRLKPASTSVPATIKIKPLLDKPIAFQISIQKGNERHAYNVDWSGKISRMRVSTEAFSRLESQSNATRAVETSI